MKTFLSCLLIILSVAVSQHGYATVRLICPKDVDLGCNPRNIKKPNPNSLKYESDCKKVKVKLIDELLIEDEENCLFKLSLTYEATDDCGDTDQCVHTITWKEDNEDPIIENCQKEIDLGCNPYYIPPPDPGSIEASDNCGIKEVVLHSEKYKNTKCRSELTREYRAYDHCGNYATCIQVIRWITDFLPPKTECKDIQLGCNAGGSIPPPDPSSVKAKDNCCLGETIHLFDSDITVFGCEYSLLRYYETSDCCGNKDTCIQTISWLEDLNPPQFIACPPDIDLGCNPDLTDLTDPSINYVAAQDDCGDVTIELVQDLTENEGCAYKRTQRWKATDDCGNMNFCERTITYSLDNSDPIIIECPPDLELGCVQPGFEIPDATPELVKWEDDCGAEVTVEEGIDIVVVGCISYYTRKYIVTDKCGNSAECFQTISWIFDNQPPVFTKCPPHIDLGCNPQPGEIIVDPSNVVVEAEDACGEVTISYEGSESFEDGCKRLIVQTWKATDVCGNMSFCRRRISYTIDTEPPVIISCPEDVDLGCFLQPPSFVEDDPIVVIEAEDNCGEVHYNYLGSEETQEGCMYFKKHTWEVLDNCGNASYCSFTIKYTVDPDPPIILECPPNIELGCVGDDFQIPPPSPEDVEWIDNCGGASVEVIESFSLLSVGCTTYQTNKYIVKDDCGNTSECFQTISWIYDVDPPIFTQCPPDIDLGCNPDLDDLADPSLNAVVAEDFCGEVNIERLEDEVFVQDDCTYKRIQTWKATDQCGNMSTCSRIIKYTLDDDPPVIVSCPPDLNFGCVGDDFQIPEPTPEEVVFEDNCGATVEVLPFIDIVVFNCTYSFGYVYIVTDNCGNADTCIQHITWTFDNIGPSFTYCPQNIDLGCNPDQETIQEALNDEPIVEDFCGEIDIDLSEVRVEDGCMILINQRWVAIDECENVTVCSRTIKYTVDTVPPVVISCPESAHLGCLQIAPFFAPFNPDDYDVTDNCGNVNFAHYDQIIDSETEECLRTFRRFVTIFDDCGNLNSCITEYSWYEVNDPQLDIPFPDDLTIVCGEIPPAPDYGDRNCGIGIPILLQEITVGDCATGNCTVIRVWSKKDCFGNVTIHVQAITLICQDITTLRNGVNTRDLNTEQQDFNIFPNPGTDILNIKTNLKNDQAHQILIFNEVGQSVFSESNLESINDLKTIDVGDFTPGIYFIELRTEGFRTIKKWIKSR